MNSVDEYRSLKRVNYSLLKSIIEDSPEPESVDGISVTLGSLVDCELTTPELFGELFAVIDDYPGEKPRKVVDDIFHRFRDEQYVPLMTQLDDSFITILMNKNEYRGNLGYEARIAKCIEECSAYYSQKLSAHGKQIVDSKLVEKSLHIASCIRSGRFTSPFLFTPPQIEVSYQKIVLFSVGGVECKCLIDMVLENTSDDIVMLGSYALPGKHLLLVDFKTMKGKTTRFESQMWAYKYDRQGAFYKHGMSQWLAYNKPGYTVAGFMFLVESNTNPGKPICWFLSQKDEMIGRWGAYKECDGYTCALGSTDSPDNIAQQVSLDVLGFEQAITLYRWHNENDEWEYPRHVIEANGLLTTNQY